MRLIAIDIVHQRDVLPHPLLDSGCPLVCCIKQRFVIAGSRLEQDSQYECSGLVIQWHQQTLAVEVKLQQLLCARHRGVPAVQELQIVAARKAAEAPIGGRIAGIWPLPGLNEDGLAEPVPCSKLGQDLVGIGVRARWRCGGHEQAG